MDQPSENFRRRETMTVGVPMFVQRKVILAWLSPRLAAKRFGE
jgi:hypothetical protein